MPYQKGSNKLMASLGVDTASVEKSYLNRNLNREPSKWVDFPMYDLIIPRLYARNPKVAQEVEAAKEDERVTNMFCDESKLYEQVRRFTDADSFTPSKKGYVNYEAAWQLFREMAPKPRRNLTPKLIKPGMDIMEMFSNPGASSGFIAYPAHKEDVPDKILNVALAIINGFTDDNGREYGPYDKNFNLPAIALTRAQITDYVDEFGNLTPDKIRYKTRLVMCVDAASVAVESQFGIPLMEMLKGMRQYAGGQNDAQLSDFLLNNCSKKNWVSLDYSKFDASIQWWLIKDIFDFFSEYFPEEYKPAFDWISNNFINMQILMPNGQLIWLNKGIKSGSQFTQNVGTIADIIMQLTGLCEQCASPESKLLNGEERIREVARLARAELVARINPNPSAYTIVAMGDDSIIFTNRVLDMKRLSSYLKAMFGVTITVDGEKGFKAGSSSDAPVFLKRIWRPDGRYREDVEMWVHLIHPERKREYERKGFHPYHILYGYYLTFEGTMRQYFSEEELVNGMHKFGGGIDALAQISINDLPGSLRFQILSRGVNRTKLVKELKVQYALS